MRSTRSLTSSSRHQLRSSQKLLLLLMTNKKKMEKEERTHLPTRRTLKKTSLQLSPRRLLKVQPRILRPRLARKKEKPPKQSQSRPRKPTLKSKSPRRMRTKKKQKPLNLKVMNPVRLKEI